MAFYMAYPPEILWIVGLHWEIEEVDCLGLDHPSSLLDLQYVFSRLWFEQSDSEVEPQCSQELSLSLAYHPFLWRPSALN